MRKLLTICVVAAFASLICAQEGVGPQPSPASQKYAIFRHEDTQPAWGLSKLKAMVKQLKEDEDMNRRMSDKDYNSLSLEEKFTYTMIHGEDFSQNCDMMPAILDEHKKVFSYFPSPFDDTAAWSDRQRNFLKQNRTKVLGLIKTTILGKKRVGSNLKNAILELNGVEMIPTLVTVYNKDKKDHDILTLMMLMMKEAKFKSFLSTSIYKNLYGDEDNWRSFVTATPANQQVIIGQANAFYKNRRK